MKLSFLVVAAVAAVLASGGWVLGGEGGAGSSSPKFKVTTRRPDDRVEVRPGMDRTLFTVTSPFGISRAIIERSGGAWPAAVAVRLHLKGLSKFEVSNGKVTLDATASLQKGKTEVRQWKDGKEDAPLDEKSPWWMAVRVAGAGGKPAQELPLADGYFEIALPRALFEANPGSLTLHWIDFYRQ